MRHISKRTRLTTTIALAVVLAGTSMLYAAGAVGGTGTTFVPASHVVAGAATVSSQGETVARIHLTAGEYLLWTKGYLTKDTSQPSRGVFAGTYASGCTVKPTIGKALINGGEFDVPIVLAVAATPGGGFEPFAAALPTTPIAVTLSVDTDLELDCSGTLDTQGQPRLQVSGLRMDALQVSAAAAQPASGIQLPPLIGGSGAPTIGGSGSSTASQAR